MKTLYVTDLDGTLLRHDESLSEFTITTINQLIDRGMLFCYATARSAHTARKVTQGLSMHMPMIVYNGVFIKDGSTDTNLLSNCFDAGIKDVLHDLLNHDIYPIVYAMLEDRERFSYVFEKCNQETKDFIYSRKKDKRDHPVDYIQNLYDGTIFYISCLGTADILAPFYEKYKNQYHCIFSKDTYTHTQWLELMPLNVSKASAVVQLKNLLGCDKVVAFGDGKNDIEMFKIVDESYAVANAVDELKEKATGIIESNEADGVAKWLLENYRINNCI